MLIPENLENAKIQKKFSLNVSDNSQHHQGQLLEF